MEPIQAAAQDLAALVQPGDQLKRVLPQAYRERPGRPSRYSLATAQHTLQLIASLMRQDSQDPRKPGRDLAWWRIPTWTAAFPRALIIGAASGLAIWLGWGLQFRFELSGPALSLDACDAWPGPSTRPRPVLVRRRWTWLVPS